MRRIVPVAVVIDLDQGETMATDLIATPPCSWMARIVS
jgi:hypothetical protein